MLIRIVTLSHSVWSVTSKKMAKYADRVNKTVQGSLTELS